VECPFMAVWKLGLSIDLYGWKLKLPYRF
jgi:hypothetical protein